VEAKAYLRPRGWPHPPADARARPSAPLRPRRTRLPATTSRRVRRAPSPPITNIANLTGLSGQRCKPFGSAVDTRRTLRYNGVGMWSRILIVVLTLLVLLLIVGFVAGMTASPSRPYSTPV